MEEKTAKEGPTADQQEDLRVRTFGTYNILHIIYATSYGDVEGMIKGTQESNWEIDRKAAIKSILLDSYLDVYMLQEVGTQELYDICSEDVLSYYGYVHTLHLPDRTDGVAVFWKKKKYERLYHTCITHLNGKVTILVKLRDILLDKTLYVVSVHLHWRGGDSMAKQLLEVTSYVDDLITTNEDCLGVVVGGDFNYTYGRGISNYQDDMIKNASLMVLNPRDRETTCHDAKLDWIFWKPGGGSASMREEVGHRWAVAAVERSKKKLESSGCSPSDHTLVAATLRIE